MNTFLLHRSFVLKVFNTYANNLSIAFWSKTSSFSSLVSTTSTTTSSFSQNINIITFFSTRTHTAYPGMLILNKLLSITFISDIAIISGISFAVRRMPCNIGKFLDKLRISQCRIENPFSFLALSKEIPVCLIL